MNEAAYHQFLQVFIEETGTQVGSYKRAARKSSSGWATVRIFCSSTFKDQLVERYVLKSVVVPELELWGRERSIEIVLIDLVWGIVAGSTAEHTIRTCLSEIDLCASANGAPYFLYLGGQRYGWAPTPEDIGSDFLIQKYNILGGASVTAMEVLHGSLRAVNPNAIYCLRDASFVERVPEAVKMDYSEKAGSVGEACQQALLDAIKASNSGRLFHYNPLDGNYEAKLGGISMHLPVSVEGHGGNWQHFASEVSRSLKAAISEQYPLSEVHEEAGSFHGMAAQHDLYVESLLEHAVPRPESLEQVKSLVRRAAESSSNHGRLITVGSPSGNGKSSLIGQLSQSLRSDGYSVIHHFVGPAERSDEVGILARRVTAELRAVWSRDTADDLPDDVAEICNLCKQTILLGPGEIGTVRPPVILIIDALNQLNAENADKKLEWLPSLDDCACLPVGLVIVVSTTPGAEFDLLRSRSVAATGCGTSDACALEEATTVFQLGSLSEADKSSIARANLARYAKAFSDEQLDTFLKNSGASSPLWQNIAMAYLRQHALFETLTGMIQALPSRVEDLINMELEIAESEIGFYHVKALLLSCILARQGLRESEAILLVPEVAKLLADFDRNAAHSCTSDPPSDLSMDTVLWSRLRAQLDIFLLHFMCGAPIVLTPSHSIVRDAIQSKYDVVESTPLVRKLIAEFFQREISTIDASRRAIEGSWQLIQLGDMGALSNLLCTSSVFRYQWLGAGDTGQWELLQLWREVDGDGESCKTEGLISSASASAAAASGTNEEGGGEEGEGEVPSKSIVSLTQWALSLSARLIDHPSQCVVVDTFILLRSIFELLGMMRREQVALPFLESMESRIVESSADLEDTHEGDASVVWTKKLVLAWTHSSMAESLFEQGKYTAAIPIFESSIKEFQGIPTLAPHECIANCHVQLGRIYDAEKKPHKALDAFEAARKIYSELDLGKGEEEAVFVRQLFAARKVAQGSSLSALHEADMWSEIANVYFGGDFGGKDQEQGGSTVHDLDLAEECYRKTLALRRRFLGDKHPKTARALWGIGICERGKGIDDNGGVKDLAMLDKSIQTHQDVLEIFQHSLGPWHPDTADMMYNIAFLLGDKGDFVPALDLFNAALNIYIRTYGGRHRHVGWTLHDIGETARKAGNRRAAIDAFERALAIRTEALGPDDEDTVATADSLVQSVTDDLLHDVIERIEKKRLI